MKFIYTFILPSLDWKALERRVLRMQYQIAKHYEVRNMALVAIWQRKLVTSFAAQMLAMRSVFNSTGIRSSGPDGLSYPTIVQFWMIADLLKRIASISGFYVAGAVKRVWIPKNILVAEKNRPLGIPNIIDRAVQALYLLALAPCAEGSADRHSYGYRPGLGAHSAITALYNIFHFGARKPVLIFNADIKSFFDSVSHAWLLSNIPLDTHILSQFLLAGFIDKGVFTNTVEGFPQGGNISPTIANMALDGLTDWILNRIKSIKPSALERVNLVRYADDFLVTGSQFQDLFVAIIIPAIHEFLGVRGLTLNTIKSVLIDRKDGFDYLGYTFQYVSNKLKKGTWMWLLTPSVKKVAIFRAKLELIFRNALNGKQLIIQLSMSLRGWAQYYILAHSSVAFNDMEVWIHRNYFEWCKRKFPKASYNWIYKNCFKLVEGRRIPCFKPGTDLEVLLFDIKSFKSVRIGATPVKRTNLYLQKRWLKGAKGPSKSTDASS